MLRLILLTLALISVFTTSAVYAHSRGPYLPQDGDLQLPGRLLVRDGLNERCEDRRFPCNGRSELVLVETGSTFEFGNVGYDCVEIDDGAYGALKCTQRDFTRLGVYSACVQSTPSLPLASDLEFRGFFCSK